MVVASVSVSDPSDLAPRCSPRLPVRRARSPRAPVRALVAGWLFIAGACGTDAKGIDACRRIETARCRAAAACGLIQDARSCERFYRDQCLHGFAGPEPSDRDVERCVQVIETAAECASTGDDSAACRNACAIVERPEESPGCAFLNPESEDEDDDEPVGGAGGSGGDAAEGGSDAADGEPAGAGGAASG